MHTKKSIQSLRLLKQGLVKPAESEEEFRQLFRLLQPVTTIYYCRPGDPPSLVYRSCLESSIYTEKMRGREDILKGRFSGGKLAYVLFDDFALYANAFTREIEDYTEIQRTILHAIRTTGPLTPRQLKEETGILNKHLRPALTRLQQANVLYEHQIDGDWDRAWSLFEETWPEINLCREQRITDRSNVIERYFRASVFATMEQVKSWSEFPTTGIRSIISSLINRDLIFTADIPGLGPGWIHSAYRETKVPDIPTTVFMLHRADYLVRSELSALKKRFGTKDILQYILVNGEFIGAVKGHWRIGPHDVDDVILDVSKQNAKKLKTKIINEISKVYFPPRSNIILYNGEQN